MKTSFFICLLLFSLSDTAFSENEPYIKPSNRVQGNEGDSLTVTCHAKNLLYLPKKIYWSLKDQEIGEKHHFKQNFIQHQDSINTTSFYIRQLHRSDAGVYQCVLVFHDNTEKISNLILHVVGKNFSSSCGHTRFRCQSTEDCIFLRYRCDGLPHCPDGSDEINCGAFICETKFQCENGRCIDQLHVCDGSDNCGDYSDEIRCHINKMDSRDRKAGVTLVSTLTPSISDADHFNWLKTTVYIVIGCTVALVIFISFIVIVVFRVKMKRLRARRVARALERHRRHQSGVQPCRQPEHEAFLPVGSNSHFGNIIVNVNNGVQYVPNSEFSGLVESPPSYADVVGIEVEHRESPPPAYSTIDRHPKTITETATNSSRIDLSSQTVMQTPSTSSLTAAENRAQPPNIFASVEGAAHPIRAAASPVSINTNSTPTNINNSVLTEQQQPSSSSSSKNNTCVPTSEIHGAAPKLASYRPSTAANDIVASSSSTSSNIFMSVEGAAASLNRPSARNNTSAQETPVESSSQPVTQSSQLINAADAESSGDIPAGGGHLTVRAGKICLRSDSSPSARATNPPIKGHLEVKGGQIVIKQERSGPGPVSEVARSYDSDDSSVSGGAIGVQEGRIVLR